MYAVRWLKTAGLEGKGVVDLILRFLLMLGKFSYINLTTSFTVIFTENQTHKSEKMNRKQQWWFDARGSETHPVPFSDGRNIPEQTAGMAMRPERSPGLGERAPGQTAGVHGSIEPLFIASPPSGIAPPMFPGPAQTLSSTKPSLRFPSEKVILLSTGFLRLCLYFSWRTHLILLHIL